MIGSITAIKMVRVLAIHQLLHVHYRDRERFSFSFTLSPLLSLCVQILVLLMREKCQTHSLN